MSNKLSIWIGIVSSVVTIALTVLNYNLNKQMTEAQIEIDRIEAELKIKSQALEESREKTERYEFVYKVLPDILNKDKTQVVLTTNLISLALTEEEAQKLFVGLSNSEDAKVQDIGKTAMQGIAREKSNYQTAIEFEKDGFDYLIFGDIENAIQSFDAAEKAYPTFHSVYGISRLLKKNKDQWSDMNVRKSVYNQIINEYSWKAPSSAISELRKLSEN